MFPEHQTPNANTPENVARVVNFVENQIHLERDVAPTNLTPDQQKIQVQIERGVSPTSLTPDQQRIIKVEVQKLLKIYDPEYFKSDFANICIIAMRRVETALFPES